jgi:hypothetical protein
LFAISIAALIYLLLCTIIEMCSQGTNEQPAAKKYPPFAGVLLKLLFIIAFIYWVLGIGMFVRAQKCYAAIEKSGSSWPDNCCKTGFQDSNEDICGRTLRGEWFAGVLVIASWYALTFTFSINATTAHCPV